MLPSHTCAHTHTHKSREESPLYIYQWACPNHNGRQMQGVGKVSHTHIIVWADKKNICLHTYEKRQNYTDTFFFLLISRMYTFLSSSIVTHTYTNGQCSIHLTCLAVADNNDQKSPWEGLVRRWAVPFTKTTHYSTQCLDEWPRRACS